MDPVVFANVVSDIIQRRCIDVRFKSIGFLMDALAEEKRDDAVVAITQALSQSSDWTRSAFIVSALPYVKEKLNHAYANRASSNGAAADHQEAGDVRRSGRR